MADGKRQGEERGGGKKEEKRGKERKRKEKKGLFIVRFRPPICKGEQGNAKRGLFSRALFLAAGGRKSIFRGDPKREKTVSCEFFKLCFFK